MPFRALVPTVLVVLACPAVARSAVAYPALRPAPEETIYALRTPQPTPTLVEINVSAGAVSSELHTPLASITPGATASYAVEQVGDEVWVGTQDGVVRYTTGPLAYLDRVLAGESIRSIRRSSRGALVVGQGRVYELNSGGTVLASHTVAVHTTNVVEFGDSYLAVNGSGVFLADDTFQTTLSFGADAFDAASTLGYVYLPDHVRVLKDGRVVVSAMTSVAILAADGSVVSVLNPAPYEQDIVQTESGLFLVPGLLEEVLFDAATETAWSIGSLGADTRAFALSTPTARDASFAARRCAGAINSTGGAASLSLLGSRESAYAQLAAIGTGLPPGVTTLTIFGVSPYAAPFGDGTLCISPFAPGIVRGTAATSTPMGDIAMEFDFATSAGGAMFLPGSTWHFQVLYRDQPGAFNGSDSASITFSL